MRKAKPAVTMQAATGPVRVSTLDVSPLSGPITKHLAKKNKWVVRTVQIRGGQALEQLHEAISAGGS